MATYRIGQVASLLAVSVDTVRTWIDEGRIAATRSDGGHRIIDGKDLAEFLQQSADLETEHGERISARNRFVGLVTRVVQDNVMAQVEIQAGGHRFVSLISSEAAREMKLEQGVLAAAVVKSTNVVIELP
ncbi:MAG: helix-turn-helix transcriptional regulator [Actinomycetota bacterium]|nr:helix-turn-helix transcriptional regulator [Actinomycetota bacterium]MED5265040.1 helix-turn-helix transcriptional regulator [Actinomycetota bacterium]|tara:strand:+ start:145 stop:534 length:390 start_codon:yes stop_codon:yes gene_type:complete